MSLRNRALRSALAAGFLLATAFGAGVAQGAHLSIFGLTTDNRLVKFSPADPSVLTLNVKIAGLRAGETLIGIDKRPLDGKLYSVGKLGTSGWLYTIDATTGAASFVADLDRTSDGAPVELSGIEFGFDFNPAADALRVISDTGQNLRILPSDRVVATIQRFTGDTFTDGTLNDAGTTATGVSAAAYTNSDTDAATGTTLYDLDASLDDLVLQSPPNDGTLVNVADLGASTTIFAGFDIRTIDGMNTAYASLTRQVGNGAIVANLYLVDLAIGAVTDLGRIGGPKVLRDIAAA
jgi:uncharacterized protein DUF4394